MEKTCQFCGGTMRPIIPNAPILMYENSQWHLADIYHEEQSDLTERHEEVERRGGRT